MDEKQLALLKSLGGPRTLADIPRLVRPYIYGDPGTGKTDLAVKIVDAIGGTPIWITGDSGWSTVLKYPEVAERTYFSEFDSFAAMRLMVQAREEGIEPFCDCDTLVWDTASTGINSMLRTVVREKPLPGESKDPSIEAWGHYRMVESALKDTVEVFRKSSMHVIYLAHIRDPTDKDKEKKRFAIRPAGPEACYRIIAQEANLIGWLYKEKENRLLQVNPTLQETAKTQIPTIEEKSYPVAEIPKLLAKYVNS